MFISCLCPIFTSASAPSRSSCSYGTETSKKKGGGFGERKESVLKFPTHPIPGSRKPSPKVYCASQLHCTEVFSEKENKQSCFDNQRVNRSDKIRYRTLNDSSDQSYGVCGSMFLFYLFIYYNFRSIAFCRNYHLTLISKCVAESLGLHVRS